MKSTLLECLACGVKKEESEFYKLHGNPQASKCKPCKRQYQKDRLKDPVKLARKRQLEKEAYQANKCERNENKKALLNSSVPHRASVILQNSRASANAKGLEFTITKDFILSLFQSQGGRCALSGEELETSGDRYLSNLMSLDRIDSSIGYTEKNVQWVCVKYNMMKAHANLEEFVEMCRKVVGVYDA